MGKKPPLQKFTVRMRETVIAEYEVLVPDRDAAVAWREHGVTPESRTELETVDWAVERVDDPPEKSPRKRAAPR